MSWFPDLSTSTMIDAGDHVRAIGWLSAGRSYTRGQVTDEFVVKLEEFARGWFESTEALGWGLFMGVHNCELCEQFMAGGNFGVARNGLLFVAPEMIMHYITTHKYRPPDDFVAAIMESPPPGTEAYKAAVEPFHTLYKQLWQSGKRAIPGAPRLTTVAPKRTRSARDR